MIQFLYVLPDEIAIFSYDHREYGLLIWFLIRIVPWLLFPSLLYLLARSNTVRKKLVFGGSLVISGFLIMLGNPVIAAGIRVDTRIRQNEKLHEQVGGFMGAMFTLNGNASQKKAVMLEFSKENLDSRFKRWWTWNPPGNCIAGEARESKEPTFICVCAVHDGIIVFSRWDGVDPMLKWKDRNPRLVPASPGQPATQRKMNLAFQKLLNSRGISNKVQGSDLRFVDPIEILGNL